MDTRFNAKHTSIIGYCASSTECSEHSLKLFKKKFKSLSLLSETKIELRLNRQS